MIYKTNYIQISKTELFEPSICVYLPNTKKFWEKENIEPFEITNLFITPKDNFILQTIVRNLYLNVHATGELTGDNVSYKKLNFDEAFEWLISNGYEEFTYAQIL